MYSKYVIFRVFFKEMEFLGTPDSDYHDFILTTDKKKSIKLLLNHLIKNTKNWNFLTFKNIPENSIAVNEIRRFFNSEKRFIERNANKCPFLFLPKSYEEFYQKLGRKFRKNIRNRENKLRKMGDIEYKSYNEFPSINEAMNILFDLNRKRFRAIGRQGFFEDQKHQAFHKEIAELFSRNGWLRLGILTVNDIPVSAEYSFAYKQKNYAFLSGFDPKYSKFGVGRLCELYHIRDAIEDGFKEYDWMRGFEEYIEEWTSDYKYMLKIFFILVLIVFFVQVITTRTR